MRTSTVKYELFLLEKLVSPNQTIVKSRSLVFRDVPKTVKNNVMYVRRSNFLSIL
jgi:hypothetical protein